MKHGLRELLAGEDSGWGPALSVVALLGLGLGLAALGLIDLSSVVTGPRAMSCADFLAAPRSARWVSLSGCRLELMGAATRRFKGWKAPRDGGPALGARNLELFIPLGVMGSTPRLESPVLVSTDDKELLGLVDQLSALQDEEAVETFIDDHAPALEASLAPPTLTGYVEAFDSFSSRTAKGVLEEEGSLVLRQGRAPETTQSLCSLTLGLALAAWAFLPMVRRVRLWREAGGQG